MAIHINNTGYFGKADYLAIGEICHMSLAKKWEQMVFAKTKKINIFDSNHLIIILSKNRVVDNGL